MEMDLGEEDEQRVQENVQDLEKSGREAGLTSSPSRDVKEELIERRYREKSERGGDGKVSSESTEETERIVIEDSVDGESFMVRTVMPERGDEEGEQPVPPGEVLTPPVNESTPIGERGIKKED